MFRDLGFQGCQGLEVFKGLEVWRFRGSRVKAFGVELSNVSR